MNKINLLEKAIEFSEKCFSEKDEQVSAQISFIAGYRTAFDWISVNEQLPDSDRRVFATNMDYNGRPIWITHVENGKLVRMSDPFFGRCEATHWRDIFVKY